MQKKTENIWLYGIVLLSAALCAFLLWLVYFKTNKTVLQGLQFLPTANAICNASAAVCLSLGWRAILKQQILAHQRWMKAAAGFSLLFLIQYLIYHYFYGSTAFLGQGWVRVVYFSILISHIVLSIVVAPLVLITLFFAFNSRFVAHKKIARWTLPLWLYVSITGVLVFLFLRLVNWG